MTNQVATNLITPSSSEYVESALRTVGFAGRTHGFLAHSILAAFVQFGAFLFPAYVGQAIIEQNNAFRDKVFRKQK